VTRRATDSGSDSFPDQEASFEGIGYLRDPEGSIPLPLFEK
jgi:hypothetical protein